MKQLFQDLKSGEISLKELPRPSPGANQVLVKSICSLVSPGTERMLLEFGQGSWLAKARQQPDKVREVLQKIKNDGLSPTLKAVFNKLNQPLPLGYSNLGIVEEVGSAGLGIKKGMRVLTNGPHAEMALVHAHLCVAVPEQVQNDDAVFGILAAIALQGNRLLKPELGETVAVIGLGLVGLISVQLLKANGCKVLAFDPNPQRVALAQEAGVAAYVLDESCDPVKIASAASAGYGIDGVLICASTNSNQPIEIAPQMCRKRGRVVLVGVVGLELSRRDFYEKEISFQVSCSYGPGRYDAFYENKGLDYPIGFVRWTEERNIIAVLELMQQNRLSCASYISGRHKFNQADKKYAEIVQDSSQLGILFEYVQEQDLSSRKVILSASNFSAKTNLNLSFIGAGSHVQATLVPAFSKTAAKLRGICSRTGVAASKIAQDFSFNFNSTEINDILQDADCQAVVISTRHDSHADLAAMCINAGKHVFVEKPLALNIEQLKKVAQALDQNPEIQVAIGFNRRFAPATVAISEKLKNRHQPMAITITVNAGAIAASNWNNDPEQGGGRIIGEACHFIDLAQALTSSAIEKVYCQALHLGDDKVLNNACISLEFLDGSIASINYLCNGDKSIAKEKIQVFCEGKVYEIDNFTKVSGLGAKHALKNGLKGQNKGHQACAATFIEAIKTGNSEYFDRNLSLHISLACLAAIESSRRERVIYMNEFSAEFSDQQQRYFEGERFRVQGS
jgi:predicted dehydrogenase/threonine dehydrogenase-like Zn-dependent dehydrogenase